MLAYKLRLRRPHENLQIYTYDNRLEEELCTLGGLLSCPEKLFRSGEALTFDDDRKRCTLYLLGFEYILENSSAVVALVVIWYSLYYVLEFLYVPY